MGRKEDQIKHAAKVALVTFAQKLSNDLGMEPTFDEACVDGPVISENGMATIPVDINNVEGFHSILKQMKLYFLNHIW